MIVPTPVPPKPTRTPATTKPTWATIREMAENCPLEDLTVAMAVFISRIDEELNK